MISGLNQELEILGKTFHFQTELSDQDGLSIRTEVFVGGKVVATRDMELEPEDHHAGPEAIRAKMKEQHNRTLTTFVARARRYQEQGRDGIAAAAEPVDAVVSSAPGEAPAEPPSATATPTAEPTPTERAVAVSAPPAVAASASPAGAGAAPEISESAALMLSVRRYFAKFRRLIELAGTITADAEERLERAAKGFEWMVHSPIFNEIRVDEQVRCHLVKEQIDEWLEGERDHEAGKGVWEEIETYSAYLGGVNRRGELQELDQQFLLWALDETQARGMSEEIRRPLGQALYGRDAKLDEMLDEPEEVADRTWIAHLRRVLMQI